MTPSVAGWMIGGVTVALLIMLIVVRMARRMDGGDPGSSSSARKIRLAGVAVALFAIGFVIAGFLAIRAGQSGPPASSTEATP